VPLLPVLLPCLEDHDVELKIKAKKKKEKSSGGVDGVDGVDNNNSEDDGRLTFLKSTATTKPTTNSAAPVSLPSPATTATSSSDSGSDSRTPDRGSDSGSDSGSDNQQQPKWSEGGGPAASSSPLPFSSVYHSIAQAHDRRKDVPIVTSANFLQSLGVTNAYGGLLLFARTLSLSVSVLKEYLWGLPDNCYLYCHSLLSLQGKPRAGMAPKLRQIQKFVEILDRLVADASSHTPPLPPDLDTPSASSPPPPPFDESLPSQPPPLPPHSRRKLKIVDVGCGRGYLTFAAHHHFAQKVAGRLRTVFKNFLTNYFHEMAKPL
jgi:hypothetical protein